MTKFTIGIATPTREEAIEMLEAMIYDKQIKSRENCNSNSIEIYSNPTCKVIWIEEYSLKHRGSRFNVVYCKNPIQRTAWFVDVIEPYILDYDMVSGLRRWEELRNIEITKIYNRVKTTQK